jgi:hypothetical protein
MTEQRMGSSRIRNAQMAIRFLVFCWAAAAAAQTGSTGSATGAEAPLTVAEVVQTALRDYPQIHVTR